MRAPGPKAVSEIPLDQEGSYSDADEDLVEAWLSGDQGAYARLYERYETSLYYMCLRELDDPHLAEDVVQDAFLRVFLSRGRFEPGKRFWPWLLTIARRRCVDMQRLNATTKQFEDLDLIPRARHRVDTTVKEILATEDWAELNRALDELPWRQRRALLLYVLEGLSYPEIAALENVSVGAVKVLVVRARRALRAARQSGGFASFLPAPGFFRWRVRRAFSRVGRSIQPGSEGVWSTTAQFLFSTTVITALALSGTTPSGAAETPNVSIPYAETRGAISQNSGNPATSNPALYVDNRGEATQGSESSTQGWIQSQAMRAIDPTHDSTPESTQFTSFETSPDYERDHTIFAAGQRFGCDDPRCRVLFVSRDGGATWERLPATLFMGGTILLPPAYPNDGRIFAMGPLGLQESSDAGASFRIVSQATGSAALSPAFNEGDPRILIGAMPVMEYWADTGVTRPALINVASVDPIRIALSPSYDRDRLTVIGATRSSAEGGLTRLYDPVLESVIHRCDGTVCSIFPLTKHQGSPSVWLSEQFEQDGVAYAFTQYELFRSTDRAKTFQSLALPSGKFKFQILYDVAINSKGVSGTNLYIAGGDTLEKRNLLRSSDAGRSWSAILLPDWLEGRGKLVMKTPSERLLLAGEVEGLLCSEDDGVTWEQRCSAET